MMWDWHSWGWWSWPLMMAGMLAFWALVIWLIVTLMRSDRTPNTDAEAVLARRFARGEIEAAEYEQRLDVLRRGRRDHAATP